MFDPFDLFDVPRAVSFNGQDLERAYFSLQSTWHPDRFIGAPLEAQRKAQETAIQVNEAYDILKCPLKRIHTLLIQEGFQRPEREDPGILLEVMEIREAMEDEEQRPHLKVRLQKNHEDLLEKAQEAYDQRDLQTLYQSLTRLQYGQKLLRNMT